jgi:hypothetical protein
MTLLSQTHTPLSPVFHCHHGAAHLSTLPMDFGQAEQRTAVAAVEDAVKPAPKQLGDQAIGVVQ